MLAYFPAQLFCVSSNCVPAKKGTQMAKKRNRKIRIKRSKNSRQKSRRIRTKRKGRNRTNGQYLAQPPDTRLRRLLIPTPEGVREVVIRGSKEASRLGKFWASTQKYFQTGDDTALLRFKDKTFTDASGIRHVFPTNLKQLDRLASAGVLSFESIYAGGGR